MTTYERIEFLRKKEGISQGNLEKELEMSNGSISKWKNSMPKPERLQKIADHFGVTIDFLMGNTDAIICPECEYHYNPLDEISCKEHEEVHVAMQEAIELYGFYFDSEYCYENVVLDLQTFTDNTYGLDLKDKISCYVDYLKCNFCTVLRKNRFQTKYASFDEYARTQIIKDKNEDFMSAKLFAALCDAYGIDKTYINDNALLLARTSKNNQLMRILAYLEKLSPEMLNAFEIQTKALAEQNIKE